MTLVLQLDGFTYNAIESLLLAERTMARNTINNGNPYEYNE
jgi:hypothetical protein